jgi:hypothetical protein
MEAIRAFRDAEERFMRDTGRDFDCYIASEEAVFQLGREYAKQALIGGPGSLKGVPRRMEFCGRLVVTDFTRHGAEIGVGTILSSG